MCVLFPVLTIEFHDRHAFRFCVQTANIDINTVRIRAWDIKWFHPAMLAKCVFGNTGIKRVSRNILVTGEQGEFTFRDNQMQKADFIAY